MPSASTFSLDHAGRIKIYVEYDGKKYLLLHRHDRRWDDLVEKLKKRFKLDLIEARWLFSLTRMYCFAEY